MPTVTSMETRHRDSDAHAPCEIMLHGWVHEKHAFSPWGSSRDVRGHIERAREKCADIVGYTNLLYPPRANEPKHEAL